MFRHMKDPFEEIKKVTKGKVPSLQPSLEERVRLDVLSVMFFGVKFTDSECFPLVLGSLMIWFCMFCLVL